MFLLDNFQRTGVAQMMALFGFLTLAAFIAVIVALIKPGLILWKSENPKRLVAVPWMLVVFVGVAAIGGTVTQPPEAETVQSEEQTQTDDTKSANSETSVSETEAIETADTSTPTDIPKEQSADTEGTPTSGLDMTLLSASQMFKTVGITLERGNPVNGSENWIGRNGSLVGQVIGPPKDVHSIAIMAAFDENKQATMATSARILVVLKKLFPEWTDVGHWVAESTKRGGGSTIRGDRAIETSVVREIGMVTVSIKPAE